MDAMGCVESERFGAAEAEACFPGSGVNDSWIWGYPSAGGVISIQPLQGACITTARPVGV